jgi:hypothetical protein
MVIGMLVVVLAVSGLAIDGTRAFLERRALQNAADAAALAAADQLDLDAFYEAGGESIALDPDAARAAAFEMLAQAGRDARGSVVTGDGAIEVRIRGSVKTQFLRLLGIDLIPVAVVARAEPQVGAIPDEAP